MALTPAEKQKIIGMLDQLDEAEKQKALSSLEAFGNWLYNAASSIYYKVKEVLSGLWNSICNFFS